MRISIFILILLFGGTVHSQQLPQFSQYMHNRLVLNPAFAGTEKCLNIGLDVRKQWLGFSGSPFTQSLSAHTGIGKRHGVGAVIFNDKSGVESMTGLEGIYSFHAMNKNDRILSFGISVSVLQYVFDESGFKTDVANDPLLSYGSQSAIHPDAAAGVFYRGQRIYASIGLRHLLSSTVKPSSIKFLERHYFAEAGYKFRYGRKLMLEPSFLLKGIENPSVSFDLNLKALYNDRYMLGLSYRNRDAAIVMAGMYYNDFFVAINYDIITSKIFYYNYGSVELFISYKICRAYSKRNRVVSCPAYN